MTAEDFKNRIKKNIPPFVKETMVSEGILWAAGNMFLFMYNAIMGLKDCYWTGTGLKLTARENRIFGTTGGNILISEDGTILTDEAGNQIYLEEDNKEKNLTDQLQQRFVILTKRGTEQGMVNDLRNILNDQNGTVNFYDYKTSGMVMGTSYLGNPETVLWSKVILFTPSYGLIFTQDILDNLNKFLIPIDAEFIRG